MSTMESADGHQVHYVDHGGDGPAVVLLHSFLMDGGMWASQVEYLGDDFRLITVDERGHGDTPADAQFDYWDVARDVFAVMDHLGVDRTAVIGTSQGGFIALRMALLAPSKIVSLAVLGTSGEAEDPEVAAVYRQLAAAWTEAGRDAVIDAVATICLGDFDAEPWKAKWREIQGDRFNRILDTLVSRDGLLHRAAEIQAPTLVLHGTADAAYPVSKAEALVAALPGAQPVVTVEGGAHFLSLTHAAVVNPHLRKFLEAHPVC